MGSETAHGCLAFMTGSAVEAFLTKSTAARLPCKAAMDIDISYGGATDRAEFLGLIKGETHGRTRTVQHRVAEE